MLYADDAGVVSQSAEKLTKLMGVTVVVCAALGLTVLEAKTRIMYLRTKGMPESHRCIQRRGRWQGVQPNERVRIPWGEYPPQCRPVYRDQRVLTQRMVQLPESPPRIVPSSLSGRAIAYRRRSLRRVRRHRPKRQGSSSDGCCLFRSHHGPIVVRLSFPTPMIGM